MLPKHLVTVAACKKKKRQIPISVIAHTGQEMLGSPELSAYKPSLSDSKYTDSLEVSLLQTSPNV